jgi:hypothetical protein
MPGPFPGVDPYLEHPVRWTGFHQGLITAIAWSLNAVLPERYVATMGERLYVVEAGRSILPDAAVQERPSAPAPVERGSVATLDPVTSDDPWILPEVEGEHREVFVEILSAEDESRVITAIEVLSPTNKTRGHEGRTLYLRKQEELLSSQSHLIEIDLLRRGEHTVAAPRSRLARRGASDYLVCLHRGGAGGAFEVWPIRLRERLPWIRVPLAEEDPIVVLDLQAPFDRAYDEGGFARRLDYRRDPPIALVAEEAEWAAALLRECGLRA